VKTVKELTWFIRYIYYWNLHYPSWIQL